MGFRIEFAPDAERDLAKLDRQVARRILTFLHERVNSLDVGHRRQIYRR